MESFQAAVAAEVARQQPRQPAQERPRQADEDAFLEQVAAEIREIQQYAPEIRSPRDFVKLDRAEAFFDAVRNHGHSFAEAYRFVYADRIAEERIRRAERQAAQRTRNSELGKAHMRATTAAGTGGVTVPAAVERNIRAIMPKATEKQIQEFYQKYEKQTGG